MTPGAMDSPNYFDSLWMRECSESLPRYPVLDSDVQTDVAVIGAGYTGLSAALHLKEHSELSVSVFEKGKFGQNPSCISGGQITPVLKLTPDKMVRKFGRETGEKLNLLTGTTASRTVFSLIEKHKIDCELKKPGRIKAAHCPRHLRFLRREVRMWQARGEPVEMLDRDEITAITGSEIFFGGLIDRRAGNLNPLKYVTGLANAALGNGVNIYGETAVVSIDRAGGNWRLKTRDGHTVNATMVLVCTNALTDELVPRLKRTIMPVASMQIATEPLPEKVIENIMVNHIAGVNTMKLTNYWRKKGNRLIMGGRHAGQKFDHIKDYLNRAYPQLNDPKIDCAWGGYVAFTVNMLPHVHKLGEKFYTSIGYNASGVAMGTTFGKVLAGLLISDRYDWFPLNKIRAIPLHDIEAAREAGLKAMIAYYGVCDRLRIY